MFQNLDMRTATFFSAAVMITLAILMLNFSISRKTYPGFHFWTTAAIFSALGIALVGTRGVTPPFISIILANILIMTKHFFRKRGLLHFYNRPTQNLLDTIFISLYILLFLYFTYLSPNIIARTILFSLTVVVLNIQLLTIGCQERESCYGPQNTLLITCFIVILLWHTGRILITLLSGEEISDFLRDAGMTHIATVMILTVIDILVYTSLISLNSQRIEIEFQQALDNVQSLEGLLPICANCKKIRDDNGYWHTLEVYISTHSEAQFSHGICPDCLKELYPEVAEVIERNQL